VVLIDGNCDGAVEKHDGIRPHKSGKVNVDALFDRTMLTALDDDAETADEQDGSERTVI